MDIGMALCTVACRRKGACRNEVASLRLRLAGLKRFTAKWIMISLFDRSGVATFDRSFLCRQQRNSAEQQNHNEYVGRVTAVWQKWMRHVGDTSEQLARSLKEHGGGGAGNARSAIASTACLNGTGYGLEASRWLCPGRNLPSAAGS